MKKILHLFLFHNSLSIEYKSLKYYIINIRYYFISKGVNLKMRDLKNKLTKLIVLILLFLLIVPNISIIARATDGSVFGGAGDGTVEGTGVSYEELADTAGHAASANVGQFKNIDELNSKLDDFFGYIRWGVATLSTFGTITSFLILASAFIRLAAAPESAFQRRNVYMDILVNGLCTIFFGGLTLVMTLFYKTFAGFIQNTVFLTSEWRTAFGYALVEYKYLICGVLGLLSLTMFVIFIKDVLQLASSGNNPQERAKGMKNILITGAATIGLGGTGIIVAIFNGLLG